MKALIQHELAEIEKQHSIKILYACESGSRAWGFPSPDSDFDVRFIYIRPLEEYLTIIPNEDQLLFPINNNLDINGWDLIKVLRLMQKSNSTIFEWLQSPIVYSEDNNFKKELWTLSLNHFCARSNTHHYLGTIKMMMKTMQDDEIKIKKLFYILRSILSALYCVKHENIPPMNIVPLMELLPANLYNIVLSLIEVKAKAPEGNLVMIEPKLKEWIGSTASFCLEASSDIDKRSFDKKINDQFFRKIILEQ